MGSWRTVFILFLPFVFLAPPIGIRVRQRPGLPSAKWPSISVILHIVPELFIVFMLFSLGPTIWMSIGSKRPKTLFHGNNIIFSFLLIWQNQLMRPSSFIWTIFAQRPLGLRSTLRPAQCLINQLNSSISLMIASCNIIHVSAQWTVPNRAMPRPRLWTGFSYLGPGIDQIFVILVIVWWLFGLSYFLRLVQHFVIVVCLICGV